MRKRVLIATGAVIGVMGLSTSGAAAAQPERASAPFVCPVLKISDQGAAHSDQFKPLNDGNYTLGPGNAGSATTFNGNVPNHATNADGTGSPGGSHSAPGDTDYTAIWSGN